MLNSTPSIQVSPYYGLAEGYISSFVKLIESDRGYPRRFALSTVQRVAGLPATSEGMRIARDMTVSILDRMVSSGIIEGYQIKPKKENSPEWAFVKLGRSGAGADA